MHIWRFFLLPFSWTFGLIVILRNVLFDWGILSSYAIPIPSITIGNLRVGGTGKTPMTIYLGQLLQEHLTTGVISRGYGRKSKGFRLVEWNDNPLLSGDEPLLIRNRLKRTATVAVSEDRKKGFLKLLHLNPEVGVVLFDDAFQHRKIKSGLSILLTEYDRPIWQDQLLPVGRLREPASASKRADILVVTKSPRDLDDFKKQEVISQSGFRKENVFFSSINYSGLEAKFKETIEIQNILLVTGIDNPIPLQVELEKNAKVKPLKFPDHYTFTANDLKEIHDNFDTFVDDKTAIVTTSKDFVRLKQADVNQQMKNYPWYVMEIELQFDKQELFNQRILNYVRGI